MKDSSVQDQLLVSHYKTLDNNRLGKETAYHGVLQTKSLPFCEICSTIHQSARGNKKLKPEFSRIRGGGSISEISI